MKTLVYGSLNIDYVYEVNHMVREKETLGATSMQIFSGGKGLNQAIAFAKAGAEVFMAGKIGEDGAFLLEECKKNGIDTSNVVCTKEKSGHTIIQVDEKGQNAILLYGGTNQTQSVEQISKSIQLLEIDDYLILQNEVNGLSDLIELSNKRGVKIVLNPSPYNEAIHECDLIKVDYFILNEVEAFQMTGETKVEDIRAQLHSRYPKTAVVLTLGEEGAYYWDDKNLYFQEAIKAKVVDTTAAGDTFTGYFFTKLQQKCTPKEALYIAAKAASITVSRKGAAGSIPRWDEVLGK